MATRSLEFILGTLFLVCGGGALVLHRVLRARFNDALKNEEVFNGVKVLEVYYAIGMGSLGLGSVLVILAWIAYV